MMNSTFSKKGNNIAYAISPATNVRAANGLGGASQASTATQDRLVVGVDFGTTYSG
jgi:hypothetical protein